MAVLSTGAVTLAEWAKRVDPDGKTPAIVEILNQSNEILQDMLFMEGNLPTGHRTTIRTGLPTAAWRLLNSGVQPSKSTTAQVDEACGMLEAFSIVDKDLAQLNGNVQQFRMSEAQPFTEAMNQAMATALFYGNSSTSPEQFNGLSVRYSSLSASVANSKNILSAGGAGADNTSIWLIVWGQNTVCGAFPKGSKAGLIHEDLGETTIENANGVTGARMRAFEDHWQWKCGLVLKDWRYAVRICNIDVSNLVSKSSAADLQELMIKATHRIPNLSMGKPVFYMNRSVKQMLDIQRRDDVQAGGSLVYSDVDGKLLPAFRGIPVRTCDAILETEAVVS